MTVKMVIMDGDFGSTYRTPERISEKFPRFTREGLHPYLAGIGS
jgi:hypothetical protein